MAIVTIAEFYSNNDHPRLVKAKSAFVVHKIQDDMYKVTHLYDGYCPEKIYDGKTPVAQVEKDFNKYRYIPNQFGHGGHWIVE